MLDLEQAIAEWRQRMTAGGIRPPETLDELENHLREDVERRVRAGASEADAFDSAVLTLGDAAALKKEYRKIGGNVMKRRLLLLFGIFGLLFGTAMIVPALGKHKQRNLSTIASSHDFIAVKWTDDEVVGLLLGTTIVAAGTTVAIGSFTLRKA